MEELIISPYLLAFVFLIVALVYSAIGLGGGSSYVALMAIFGVSFVAIPTISLTLNLFVTSIGSFNFLRHRHGRLRLILPFFVSSIPMSYLGGSLHVEKEVFYWILLVSLVFVIIRTYFWKNVALNLDLGRKQQIVISLLAGSILGLIAGIVGIGGGIYLIPLIIILGLGNAKEAAACGAIFVWVNSLSGLSARIQHNPVDPFEFMPLVAAVVVGGIVGSHFGASKLSPRVMQHILGAIILIALLFLIKKLTTF